MLRDIHLPQAAWWPPAPGWWVLAMLLLVMAACIAGWLRRRAWRGPLRAALWEIDALETAYAQDGDGVRLAEGASRLLRRVARRIDPAAASRNGVAWRGFLHRHARDAGVRQALDALIDARFRAHPALDAAALLAALRAWCKCALLRQAPRAKPLPDGERETSAQRPSTVLSTGLAGEGEITAVRANET